MSALFMYTDVGTRLAGQQDVLASGAWAVGGRDTKIARPSARPVIMFSRNRRARAIHVRVVPHLALVLHVPVIWDPRAFSSGALSSGHRP